MFFFGIEARGIAVSQFYLSSMCPTVSHSVPPWLGGALVQRALLSWSLPSGWTAVLQLGNGCCQVGDNFCLLLVCLNQLVNGVVLLNGCICQVVELCCHLLCLDDFLGSSLIGKGPVAEGHAVDVAYLSKRGHPVDLPFVPPVIRKGTASPLSPCKSHVPTVERIFGPGHGRHFLRDGYSSVMSKHLAFLLLACVDGKEKFGINSLVEIGGIVVEIRLADLGVCSINVGDKLL
jgi:hypothetical protein